MNCVRSWPRAARFVSNGNITRSQVQSVSLVPVWLRSGMVSRAVDHRRKSVFTAWPSLALGFVGAFICIIYRKEGKREAKLDRHWCSAITFASLQCRPCGLLDGAPLRESDHGLATVHCCRQASHSQRRVLFPPRYNFIK